MENQKNQTADEELLWALIRKINDEEHLAEADESRKTIMAAVNQTPEALEAAAQADIREAELQLQRASLLRILADKKRKAL